MTSCRNHSTKSLPIITPKKPSIWCVARYLAHKTVITWHLFLAKVCKFLAISHNSWSGLRSEAYTRKLWKVTFICLYSQGDFHPIKSQPDLFLLTIYECRSVSDVCPQKHQLFTDALQSFFFYFSALTSSKPLNSKYNHFPSDLDVYLGHPYQIQHNK